MPRRTGSRAVAGVDAAGEGTGHHVRGPGRRRALPGSRASRYLLRDHASGKHRHKRIPADPPLHRLQDPHLRLGERRNEPAGPKRRQPPGAAARQLRRGSPAVFVYTFTRQNIHEVGEVAERIAARNGKLTFNVFSAPVGYEGPLRHDRSSLLLTPGRCWRPWLATLNPCCFRIITRWPTRTGRGCTPVRLLLSPPERLHGHRSRALLPAVPGRPDLGPERGLLRSRHGLRRLPPLRRRQCRGDGPPFPARRRSRHLPLLAGLRGHVPGGVGHGLREGENLCDRLVDPPGFSME